LPAKADRRPGGRPARRSVQDLQRRTATYQRVEEALDLPLLVLSVALIPILLIPLTIKHLSSTTRGVLDTADYVIWACFVAEYLILLALAPRRGWFIKTHKLDAILVALPMLRPLRLLRVARLLRVGRVGVTLSRVVVLSRHRLATRSAAYAAGLAAVFTVSAAALEYGLERDARSGNIKSFGDALWWATTTVTTVGYGDHYPVTGAGRVVAGLLMVVGLAVLGVTTAALAAWLVQASETAENTAQDGNLASLHNRIDQLEALLREVHAAQVSTITDGSRPNT
jgi:voltage-gated potassium channel